MASDEQENQHVQIDVHVNNTYDEEIVQQLVALNLGSKEQCIYASALTLTPFDINAVMDKLLQLEETKPNKSDVKMDQDTNELLVLGFIHESECIEHLPLIPLDVINLCFSYYTWKFSKIAKTFLRSDPLPLIDKTNCKDLWLKKVRLCCAECFFSDYPNDDMASLIAKKNVELNDLSRYLTIEGVKTGHNDWFTEQYYAETMNMISKNLIRNFGYQYTKYGPQKEKEKEKKTENDDDVEEDYIDPSWVHLQRAYEILHCIVTGINIHIFQNNALYDFAGFIRNLVDCFGSKDEREKEYLKVILHTIYGRNMKMRRYMMQLMTNYLQNDDKLNNKMYNASGIWEILEILHAIFQGLATPVKNKWKQFLETVILPLYKCQNLTYFWEPLNECCRQFIYKDQDGAIMVLQYLLNKEIWPVPTHGADYVVLLLVSLVQITLVFFEVLGDDVQWIANKEYEQLLLQIVHKIVDCMLNANDDIQFLNITIAAFEEENIANFVVTHIDQIRSDLCEAIHKNVQCANEETKERLLGIEQIFQSTDVCAWHQLKQGFLKNQ